MATGRNKLLTHATTWMNLENTALGKRGESQKSTELHDSIPREVQKGEPGDAKGLGASRLAR